MALHDINNFLLPKHCIGMVESVETRKIVVQVVDEAMLTVLRINEIVILSGSHADEKLIGIITKIVRKALEGSDGIKKSNLNSASENYCVVSLMGSFYNHDKGSNRARLKRVIHTYPGIGSEVFQANEPALRMIINAMNGEVAGNKSLQLGHFAGNSDASAVVDGNRFFQNKVCIVGDTGSGKSYTVAGILEKASELPQSNVIVYDLNGQYKELSYAEQLKICDEPDGLHIPLWFFDCEELFALLESSGDILAGQRSAIAQFILDEKRKYVAKHMRDVSDDMITADTPVPFSAEKLLDYIEKQNGSTYLTTRQNKRQYGFMFHEEETAKGDYFMQFAARIMGNAQKRIKVIDLSDVPDDMRTIVVGVITRILYEMQYCLKLTEGEVRHPLVLVCEEAYRYMAHNMQKESAAERKAQEIFERVAKEGSGCGIGLLLVSRHVAGLHSSILSQCDTIISLKLSNAKDTLALAENLTDFQSDIVNILPDLDVGECVVFGDAIMLPSKISLRQPQEKPKNTTVDFWDRWNHEEIAFDMDALLSNWITQLKR